jgi:DNA-binding response OmpR family regulator
VQAQPRPTAGQKKTAILIVDDEPDILTTFKRSLELAGYSTYGFTNPSAALEHFRQNPKAYQIVITDVRMPGMSGFELAREIRNLDRDVKIIIMSAFEMNMSEVKKVLPSLKVDDIVKKPVRLDKLTTIIQAVAQEITSVKMTKG